MQTLVEQLVYGKDDQLEESAIENYVTGMDHAELEKIRKDIHNASGSKLTKAKKQEALDTIDDLIDNSNRVFTSSNVGHAIADILVGIPAFGILQIGKIITRAVSAKDRKVYRETLYDMRSAIKAAKTVD